MYKLWNFLFGWDYGLLPLHDKDGKTKAYSIERIFWIEGRPFFGGTYIRCAEQYGAIPLTKRFKRYMNVKP